MRHTLAKLGVGSPLPLLHQGGISSGDEKNISWGEINASGRMDAERERRTSYEVEVADVPPTDKLCMSIPTDANIPM